jgi:hypothetical protein
MMRKRGGRDLQFALNVSGDEAFRVRGEKLADDLQAGLGAEGGEAVGRARDEEWIDTFHISMIVEIRKYVKLFF